MLGASSTVLFDTDKWEEVKSSNIAAVGSRGSWLVIQFKGGQVYRYADSAQLLDDLVSAPSVGKKFREVVLGAVHGELVSSTEWPDD